jgi:hypothetical protein
MAQVHYHYGHNTAGYLPEADVGTAEDFDTAKRALIDDMLSEADAYAMLGGITEDNGEQVAENLTNAAEDVNLSSGPDLP